MIGGDVVRVRTTMIALMAAVMMIVIPASPLFDKLGSDLSPVGQASAFGPGDRTIRLGYQNFQSNLATLNPLIYTMGEEMDLIWPCYSSLLQHDVNLNVVGDLATSWDVSTDGTLYHFKITSYAKFYDRLNPSAVHPLTVHDIIFTYYLVQNNSNNLQTYLPKIGTQYVISAMWAVNNYEFYIQTIRPYAPMLNALTSIPILPQFIWDGQRVNWPNFDTHNGIAPCIGSGPFYYVLDGLPTAGTAELDRSPTWFATEERGWQVHVSKIIFKSETSVDTSLADLATGAIDIDGFPSSVQYLNSIPSMPGVSRWNPVTNAVYEFNMNQMSDARRAAYGGTYKSGSSNQLLLDPVVKRAIMMCLDKQGWVDGFLDGLGAPADSLVGPSNPFHYDYGSRPGEVPITYDPAAARALLNANGWKYDLAGVENPSATPLCKYGGSDPLRFRFYTLYDGLDESLWNTGALMIANWSWSAGIDLKTLYGQKSMSFMNGAWAAADYDVWLWDWWFTLMAEASLDLMSVFTTGAIGTWSDCYWSNATFDNLYNESLFQADYATRYETLADMQSMAYLDSGCVPVAYRADLFAATNQGPERWTNWGNWTQQSLLRPDQVLPWIWMQISPDETLGQNPAPRITSMQPSYPGQQVGVGVDFTASATDNGNMLYRWFFGDGTRSGWVSSPNVNHVYTKDGYYTAWLAVREDGTPDNFTTVAKTVVQVADLSNYAPTGVDFSFWPADPDSGTLVYLNGTGTDPNGDPMTFSWDFGDGYTARGQKTTHQFTSGQLSYTVTLSVDDGHLGTGSRPVTKPHLIPVAANSPPSCSVPSYTHVVWKTATNFSVTSTDTDARDNHRYTWFWGDGSSSVTNNQKWATYSYPRKASYVLTVFADDLTGLPGHNVSGQNNVLVSGTNTAPAITGFTVSSASPSVGESVTFTGSATDADSDLLWYTFDFGDGNMEYASGIGSPSVPLVLSTSYAYSSAGTYTAYLYVTDNYSVPLSSSPRVVDAVLRNSPPEVAARSNIRASSGYAMTFSASATDIDGDTLHYVWDFGDFSDPVVGNSVSHTYAADGDYVCRVYVDDMSGLFGHNVSVASWYYIHVFDLQLAAGWNSVSVPYVGYGYKASTLGLMVGDVVSGYNPATKAYDKNFIVGVSPLPLDFAIAPGVGYWIHAATGETLHLRGMIPSTQQTISVNVPTSGGWFILALNSLKTTFKASNVPGMCVGGSISTVAAFNSTTGVYKTYITGVPPTDYALMPGQAYWCYVAAGTSGTITITYVP
jgi:ABC-type transport system substrate-binding protein/PKD repeat protein